MAFPLTVSPLTQSALQSGLISGETFGPTNLGFFGALTPQQLYQILAQPFNPVNPFGTQRPGVFNAQPQAVPSTPTPAAPSLAAAASNIPVDLAREQRRIDLAQAIAGGTFRPGMFAGSPLRGRSGGPR